METQMNAEAPAPRANRFWLFAPFVLLVLVAVAWTVAWFVIRDRTTRGIDTWLAAEAAGGRQWTCHDRNVGGYPFRILVTCGRLTAKRGPTEADVGTLAAVAQVYSPRHIIVEVGGPLRATDGRTTLEGRWKLLDMSIRTSREGLQRASLVMRDGSFTSAGPDGPPVTTSSALFEAHLRPNPARAVTEGAVDLIMRSVDAVVPGLDQLIGGQEPATIEAQVTVTQAAGVGSRPPIQEVETWRAAGGRIDLVLLALNKGARRIEAKGEFTLDDQRRPTGRIESATANVEGLLGRVVNGAGGLMSLLGPRLQAQAKGGAPTDPALKPLPPIRLADGRVYLGPLPTPGIVVPPLY
jgi:hypothetical protein